MKWSRMSIRTKITVVSVALPTVLFISLFALWARDERTKVDLRFADKARTVALSAEGTRSAVERSWESRPTSSDRARVDSRTAAISP